MLVHHADNVWREVEPEPLPELPEFKFSPRIIHGQPPKTKRHGPKPVLPSGPIKIIDVAPERSMTGMRTPHPTHEKIEINPIEQGWREYKPYFKRPIKTMAFLKPMNALEGIDKFIARVQRIMALTDQQARDEASNRVLIQQERELELTTDYLRANGIQGESLSSSTDDDDKEDANIAEHRTGRIAGAFGIKGHDEDSLPIYRDIEEASAILRRIDWERYILACGPNKRIFLVQTEDGTISATPSEDTKSNVSLDEIKELGQKAKAAVGQRPWNEIENNRRRVEYFQAIGSFFYGVMHGEQYPEQSMDELDPHLTPEGTGAPVELGFHNRHWVRDPETRNYTKHVLPEPSPVDLWPEF